MKNFILGVTFALIVSAIVVIVSVKKGYVDFAADQAPSAIEAKLAMEAVDASTDRRAPERTNPVAPTKENLASGAKLYLDHCAGCHGVPSNPDSQFAKSFYPPAPGFFHDTPDMADNENFYIVRHGIRWTGMPSWDQTLSEQQTWQIVTFLSNIEKLPADALAVFGPAPATSSHVMTMPMSH